MNLKKALRFRFVRGILATSVNSFITQGTVGIRRQFAFDPACVLFCRRDLPVPTGDTSRCGKHLLLHWGYLDACLPANCDNSELA